MKLFVHGNVKFHAVTEDTLKIKKAKNFRML